MDAGADVDPAPDASDEGEDAGDTDPETRCATTDSWDEVGDGVDWSGDGIDGMDWDCDGFASVASGGTDCDDARPDVNTSAMETDAEGLVTTALTPWGYFGLVDAVRGEDDVIEILFSDFLDSEGPYFGRVGRSVTALHLGGGLAGGRIGPGSTIHRLAHSYGPLTYGTMIAGELVDEVLDEAVIGESCLAFGVDGQPLAAWVRWDPEGTASAYVARKSAEGWSVEALASPVRNTIQCEADAAGAFYVSYVHEPDGLQALASDASGQWAAEVPSQTGSWSLFIDDFGSPDLVLVDWNDREYQYLTDRTGTWDTEDIPLDHHQAVPVAARRDAEGNPHVFLRSWLLGYVFEATGHDRQWSIDLVTASSDSRSILLVDGELAMLSQEDAPSEACGKCGPPESRLLLTSLGAVDEDCDGVAE